MSNDMNNNKQIDAFYASLASAELQAIEPAWAQGSESRLNAFRAGDVGSESWSDVKENLRKNVGFFTMSCVGCPI
jgi:hypothetical protein